MNLISTLFYILNILPTFHQKMSATVKQEKKESNLFNFLIAIIQSK